MSPSAFFDEPTTDIDCGNADQNQHDTMDAARRYVAQGARFVTGEDLTAVAGPSNSVHRSWQTDLVENAEVVTVADAKSQTEGTSSASMTTSSTATQGQLIGHKDDAQWNNLSTRVSHE